jgi:hypothetical protein
VIDIADRAAPLRWAVPLLAWLCMSGAAEAACPPAKPVRFPAGAYETALTGGIVRGERDCYTINARQGQVLTIGQSDTPDTNIVFQIYQPPWRIVGAAGDLAFSGTALPGTAEGEDARSFSGALPAPGDYLVVVGTSRGSGEYRLQIEIR